MGRNAMSLTVTDPSRSEFLTAAEAAEELRVTERFIRKLIATGDPGPCHIGNMWGHARFEWTVIDAPGLAAFGRADATPPMMTVSKPSIVSRSRARVPIFAYPGAPSGGISRSGW